MTYQYDMISLWISANNLVLSDFSLNAKYSGHNVHDYDQDAEQKPQVFRHFFATDDFRGEDGMNSYRQLIPSLY